MSAAMQEAHNLEYKREWKDDLLKWICAFANAQGGTLVIGVDDDGVNGSLILTPRWW